MIVKIKKLHDDAIIPTKAHESDTGWDLYSIEDILICWGDIVQIKTGIALEFPWYIKDIDIQVRSKSGLATKGFTIINSPGTIDKDYRGEIKIIATCLSKESYAVSKGQKIAQLVFGKHYCSDNFLLELSEVKELNNTERGDKGFGSSGK